jgi:hypothetical protein
MEKAPVVEYRTPILRGAPAGAAGTWAAGPLDAGEGLLRVQAAIDVMMTATPSNKQNNFFISLSSKS